MLTSKMMIIISVMSLCWWRKNIIVMLLSLELMLMSIFLLVSYSFLNLSLSCFLVFLTIMVAGSSLGLVMLVSLCRFFKSPNSLPIWLLM